MNYTDTSDLRPTSPFTRSRSLRDVEFMTRVATAAPVEVAGNLTKRPLTEDQTSILESIASRPFPGHGWVWGNYSKTASMLDALVRRGLVVKTESQGYPAKYRAEPFVSAAYREMENAKALARARRDKEKAAAQREVALERHGRSKRLERTLLVALSLLETEKVDPIHGTFTEDVTSEAITAARAFVANLGEQNARSAATLEKGHSPLPVQLSV